MRLRDASVIIIKALYLGLHACSDLVLLCRFLLVDSVGLVSVEVAAVVQVRIVSSVQVKLRRPRHASELRLALVLSLRLRAISLRVLLFNGVQGLIFSVACQERRVNPLLLVTHLFAGVFKGRALRLLLLLVSIDQVILDLVLLVKVFLVPILSFVSGTLRDRELPEPFAHLIQKSLLLFLIFRI